MENKLQKVQAFLSKIEGAGLMDEQQEFVIQCDQNLIGGSNSGNCINQGNGCGNVNRGCTNFGDACNGSEDNESCHNVIGREDNTDNGCILNPGNPCVINYSC